jgi:hypothetical protein
MKRNCLNKFVFLTLIFLFVNTVHASDWATGSGSCYAQGDKILDIGLPIPLGLHANFDYGFHDAISGGIGIGFVNDGVGTYGALMLRGAFHPFNLTAWSRDISGRNKFDLYLGLSANIGNAYYYNYWLRELIGCRWYFAPKVGLFLEDCGGFGYLDFGFSFKF